MSNPGHETEEQQMEFLRTNQVKKSDSRGFQLKYIPFGIVSSSLTILLYLTVGGCNLLTDKVYLAVAYAIGVIALSFAYGNVAKWCRQQKKMNGSPLFFSLFYNNAFYVFLLVFCASILFPGLKPAYGLILTQILSVGLPAWLSSLQI